MSYTGQGDCLCSRCMKAIPRRKKERGGRGRHACLPRVPCCLRPYYFHWPVSQANKGTSIPLCGTEQGDSALEQPRSHCFSGRLRAVSLFSWSVEQNVRDTQMTTRVTEGARRRPCFSRLASRGFATQRSPARALPILNLKKKRDCS